MMQMRASGWLCGIALSAASAIVPAADGIGTRHERARTLGEVWSHVSFLHPDLASSARSTAWDRAFADAAPALLAAADDAEFERGMAALLATLGDPLTAVATNAAEPSPGEPRAVPIRKIGEVLYADLRDTRTWPDYFVAQQQWQPLDARLREARSAVFDLRTGSRASVSQRISLAYAFLQSDVGVTLGCVGLPGPLIRSRSYDGWRAEQGSSSLYLHPFFEVAAAQPLSPLIPRVAATPPSQHPFAVFLVDRETLLPPCAVALALAGKGAFVSEGRIGSSELDLFTDLPLGTQSVARIRVANLMQGDGRPWQPSATVAGEDPIATALEVARTRVVGAAPDAAPPAADELPSAPTFPGDPLPGPGWRVLATARTCFIFGRFFPYRDLMDGSWRERCRVAYGDVLDAGDAEAYRVALIKLLVATGDSHVGFISDTHPRAYGVGRPLLEVRFIESRPIVTKVFAAPPVDVAVGDEIVTVEGMPVGERIARLRALTIASTPQSRDGIVARKLLSGDVGTTVRFEVDGVGGRRATSLVRATAASIAEASHVEIPAYRTQERGIGYVDLTRLQPDEVTAMFATLADAEAIVFDMRGYPQQTAWTIVPRLVDRADISAALIEQPLVRALQAAADEAPGTGTFSREMQRLPPPVAPRWGGRSVMLIDDRSLSQAEHTGLWLRAANGTRFVGMPTAGANGNVTNFRLPGGVTVALTGVGIAWPDGAPLQRRGLQPDVKVAPTIEGIRAGRDEVLEAALKHLREARGN